MAKFFMSRYFWFLPLLTSLMLVMACKDSSSPTSSRSDSESASKPVFFAVVEPHAFLLEKIGGDRVHVEVLVPTGVEPENYEATPQKMAALAKCQALFLTGMPFEKTLIPRLQSVAKNTRIVDLRDGLKLRTLELHHHADDGHEHESDEHAESAELDPHIWFSLEMLRKQANTVYQTLVACDPQGEHEYSVNLTHFEYELDLAYTPIMRFLKTRQGETVFVFHPAYGYFCDEFGLKQQAIEFEGREPKPQQLASIKATIDQLHADQSKGKAVIFVQPEFNKSSAQALADATGAKLVRHSPLKRDVLQSMKDFAEAIAAGGEAQE